ncbi:dehydrogenase [Paenibacillus eucommiae]|uniref:Toxin CptA n=1 Tax=Paenibacillus eucommiae TaxID=1355755 RepID=A0ABS4IWJ7_9BACL|nr:dehydrogenase [Paenibacillus eucommiae]MBP1990899.1 toxin CptA [Paenibacillus eucommiae]
MPNKTNEKHKPHYPSARGIRRACGKELYRAAKRLKTHITPEQMKQAETLYAKEVLLNLAFIVETGSNRKVLADWWEEHISAQIAAIWNVEIPALNRAFRESFGG